MRYHISISYSAFTLATIAGVGAGATAMYIADPSTGRRRRALLRDKVLHIRRIVREAAVDDLGRHRRFLTGIATGTWHNITAPFTTRHLDTSDDVLLARVRSESFRGLDIPAGHIVVDVYNGRVTLRGQVENPDDIRALVSTVRRIPGVRGVQNYLHLPQALPPNKLEAYRDSARRLPAL